MAQQLIFDLKALLGERYPSIGEFPPSRFVDPAQLRKRPATNIAQMSRILSCLRLPDSLIDLEVSENLLASNPNTIQIPVFAVSHKGNSRGVPP